MTMLWLVWAGTVAVRFRVHAEPGDSLWYAWVLAQGICAGTIGFMLRGPP